MNRLEALHMLGLGEDATAEDIKTAYRESAQILHPDKFATNKKLQERATEQFKNLQEAYAYLTSGKGAKAGGKRGAGSGSSAQARSAASSAYSAAYERREIEARLAGIAAARAQLVAQKDVAADEKRNGMAMAAIGALVALFTIRRPYGLLGLVAAAATTATVWGIVQVVSANKTINTLNEHLRKLGAEKKKLTAELEELE